MAILDTMVKKGMVMENGEICCAEAGKGSYFYAYFYGYSADPGCQSVGSDISRNELINQMILFALANMDEEAPE